MALAGWATPGALAGKAEATGLETAPSGGIAASQASSPAGHLFSERAPSCSVGGIRAAFRKASDLQELPPPLQDCQAQTL